MRPNWFLAFQITDPEILENIRKVQEIIVRKEDKLRDACVLVPKSHVTLSVFRIDRKDRDLEKEKLDAIRQVMRNAVDETKSPIALSFSGIGHFKDRVVFGKPISASYPPFTTSSSFSSDLHQFWSVLDGKLRAIGINEDEEEFKPHLTIMKLSKMKKRKLIKKIPEILYEEVIDLNFGTQTVKSLQLLSMDLPSDSPYYYMENEVLFDYDSQDKI